MENDSPKRGTNTFPIAYTREHNFLGIDRFRFFTVKRCAFLCIFTVKFTVPQNRKEAEIGLSCKAIFCSWQY
jgi:hypothetical protein